MYACLVMQSNEFEVAASAGVLRPESGSGVRFPHHWTEEGVVVESAFTGGHLLHLSIAGCVLNDVYREAETLGIVVDGVRVAVRGDFDRETFHSTGVEYEVEVSSEAAGPDIERLLRVVDDVAEMPKTLRAAAQVERVNNSTRM